MFKASRFGMLMRMVMWVADSEYFNSLAAATVTYYAARQEGLAGRVENGVTRAFKLLRFDDLDGSEMAMLFAMMPAIERGHLESQQLSASMVNDLVTLAALKETADHNPAPRPRIMSAADWVLDDARTFGRSAGRVALPFNEERVARALLAAGPGTVKRAMPAPASIAMPRALKAVQGVAGRQALNGGLAQVQDAQRREPRIVGYQRITDSDPCYFCALLASRGDGYKSQDSFARSNASKLPNKIFGGNEPQAIAKVHDHCRCILVPSFEAFEFTQPVAQEALQIWGSVVEDGFSGNEALNEYRSRYNKKFDSTPKQVGVHGGTVGSVPARIAQSGNKSAVRFLQSLTTQVTAA